MFSENYDSVFRQALVTHFSLMKTQGKLFFFLVAYLRKLWTDIQQAGEDIDRNYNNNLTLSKSFAVIGGRFSWPRY